AAQFVDEALAHGDAGAEPQLVDTAAAVWAARDMMAMTSEVYGSRTCERDEASAVRARIARIGSGLAQAEDHPEPARTSLPSALGIAMRLLDRGLEASLADDPAPEALSELVRASDVYTASGSTHPVP